MTRLCGNFFLYCVFRMKAELEYERYRVLVDSQPRLVDADFEKAAKELKKLPKPKKPKPPNK